MKDAIEDFMVGVYDDHPIFEGMLGSLLSFCLWFVLALMAAIIFAGLVVAGSTAGFAAMYFLGHFVSSVLFSQDMSYAPGDGLIMLGMVSTGVLVIIVCITFFLVQQARLRLGWI